VFVSKLLFYSTGNTGEMPSDETDNWIVHAIALGLTGVFVIFVILYGAIIAQQLLLAFLVALFGIAVYIAWIALRSTENTAEMPSDETDNWIVHAIALGLTGVFVIFVILYGVIIAQQLLLSSMIALFGLALYIAWVILS
jgi:ascorbate-specific PTS system EIIC-type component UlaA